MKNKKKERVDRKRERVSLDRRIEGGQEDSKGEREGGRSREVCLLGIGRHGGVHLRTQ